MTERDLDVTLPARAFAAAWLSVAAAASDDDDMPSLWRAVCIEDHGDAVLLVATDTRMLMRAWVSRAAVAAESPTWISPGLDEAPKVTVVARDVDRRMKALMSWAFRASKDDPDATVRLRVERGTDVNAPALMPELESVRLVVDTQEETLRLPTFDGDWVAWRDLESGRTPAPLQAATFSPDLLKRCGSIVVDTGTPMVRFDFAGPLGAARFSYVGGTPAVEGLVMMMRSFTDDTAPAMPEML